MINNYDIKDICTKIISIIDENNENGQLKIKINNLENKLENLKCCGNCKHNENVLLGYKINLNRKLEMNPTRNECCSCDNNRSDGSYKYCEEWEFFNYSIKERKINDIKNIFS